MKRELLIVIGIALVSLGALTRELASDSGARRFVPSRPAEGPAEARPAKPAGVFRALFVGDAGGSEPLLRSADLCIGASTVKTTGIGCQDVDPTDGEIADPQLFERRVGGSPFRMAVFGAAPPFDGRELSEADVARLAERIRALKAENPSTLAVVLPAWGPASRRTDKEESAASSALAKAGADFVISRGPRMAQRLERIDDTWFVSGTERAKEPARGGKAKLIGAALALDIGSSGGALTMKVKLYPLAFDGPAAGGRVTDARQFGEFLWRVTFATLNVAPELKRSFSIGRDDVGRYLELEDGALAPKKEEPL